MAKTSKKAAKTSSDKAEETTANVEATAAETAKNTDVTTPAPEAAKEEKIGRAHV